MIPFPALTLAWFRPWMVWLAVIVGLSMALGAQTMRLADAKLDIAQIKQQVAENVAAAERTAHKTSEVYRQQENRHAANQSKILAEGDARVAAAGRAAAAERARADRVRSDATAAAARDRAAAQGDPAACGRVADRNEALYRMVSEGFDLVVEGRAILETFDSDIRKLTDLINNDRAAICGAPPGE